MRTLFVIADSLRADRLGCYGAPAPTPFVDALARDGVRFETVRSSAPWTVPSLAAMLTGVGSHRLGLLKWEQPWPHDRPSLFDRCREGGVDVASFVFDPGHLFVHCPAAGVVGSSQDTDAMLSWLARHDGSDALFFVHHWWTHLPYLARRLPLREWNLLCRELLALLGCPDAAERGRNRARLVALYDLAVRTFSEEWLPRVVEAARPDLIAVVADHGESWGERSDVAPRDVFDLHGGHLFDEVIRIPWLLHAPGRLPPTVVRGQARGVDIGPTLLDLMALPPLPDADGVSLAPAVAAGEVPPGRLAVFSRNRDVVDAPLLPTRPEEVYLEFGCSDGRQKVLSDSTSVVAYDLEADPTERAPRPESDADPRLVARLRAEMARAVVGRCDPWDHARMRERLRALGYL